MGNELQNPNLSYDELYREAAHSGKHMDNWGNNVLNDLKKADPQAFKDVQFEQGPLKTRDRADAKIQGDYKGDHTQIADLRHGRIVVDTPEQADIARNYLNENAGEIGIEKMKDRFGKPSDTHFRDVNTKVRLENGHLAEFRVEHRGLLEAAKYTHEPYERVHYIGHPYFNIIEGFI